MIISCFLLPLVIYAITKVLSGSKFPGLVAGIGAILYPFMFSLSLHNLSDFVFAFVVCTAVLFSMKTLDDDRYFYYAGIFLGLAYYAKGTGLLLIPGYVLFHVITQRSVKKVLNNRKFLVSLLITFLILLPWFVRNYVHFRDPLFSTERFIAGHIGYKDFEKDTYSLYWGERPPDDVPSFS